jgi:hypothetical protein
MATMTVLEAEHIIDVVAAALDRGNEISTHWWHSYTSLSVLQGYDIVQIDIALNEVDPVV